jgi:ATP-dependent protease ClpP protease subunit
MNKIIVCDIDKYGEFATMLSQIENNGKFVTIEFCSGGGCVYQSLAYMARILQSPLDITTVGMGQVMSAAVLPFLAGKIRKASEYCWFMIHETQFMSDKDDKNVTQAKQEVEQTLLEEEQYYKLLARFTKRNASWWKRKIAGKGDIYISAIEALKLGLCDELF